MHALFIGEFPERCMSQHVRRDVYFLFFWQVRIGLLFHPFHNQIRLSAVESFP